MTPVALGLIGGAGLLLLASPWLWPRRAQSRTRGTPAWFDALRDRLVLSGLDRVGVPAFLVMSVVVGVAAGALVAALVGVLPLAVAAACVAAVAPWTVVSWRARTRRRASRTVWPDAVDHLLSGVRAGVPLPDAIGALADAGPVEVRPAFRAFARDYAATGDVGAALDGVKQRLADPIADRVVEILRMSREVGGAELPTVLRNLSANLRQESAVRGEVEARQSWTVSAARLGVAAPWVVLVLLSSRPDAVEAYNSPTGALVIGVGGAVSLVAYRVMLALGRLPEERRWFR